MHFILWRDKGCLLVPESKEGRKENNGNMQESSYLLLMPEADFPVITRSQLEPEYSSEHLEDQRANWVGTKTWKLWVQKNPGVGLFITSRWFVIIFFFNPWNNSETWIWMITRSFFCWKGSFRNQSTDQILINFPL